LIAAWRLLVGKWDVEEVRPPEASKAVLVGGGIGLASGVVGIGGGIFLSPVIMLSGWASAKQTAATAALFIWMNSLAGLLGAGASGQIGLDLGLLVPFGAAVLLGGGIGSRFGADGAPQNTVRKILVLVLVLAAVKRLLELI